MRGSLRESSARGSTPHPDPLPAKCGEREHGQCAQTIQQPALSLLFVAGLELRLQRGELGERRIGIGLAIGAIARALLGGGEDAVAAAIGPPVRTALAPIRPLGPFRPLAAFTAPTTLLAITARPRTALAAILAALAITPAMPPAALFAGRLGRSRCARRSAIAASGRLLGRGCRRLALLRTPRRTRVTARTAPFVRAATRPPDLDELRLRRRRLDDRLGSWLGFAAGLCGRRLDGSLRRRLRFGGGRLARDRRITAR